MFKNLTLGKKLIIAFLAVGIIPFAIVGIISLNKSSNALEKQAFNQLTSMREVKKSPNRTIFR